MGVTEEVEEEEEDFLALGFALRFLALERGASKSEPLSTASSSCSSTSSSTSLLSLSISPSIFSSSSSFSSCSSSSFFVNFLFCLPFALTGFVALLDALDCLRLAVDVVAGVDEDFDEDFDEDLEARVGSASGPTSVSEPESSSSA